MSHFYAEIKGTRGPARRCGDKGSGMWSHTRGWRNGCEVNCVHWRPSDAHAGQDVVHIYQTRGSGSGGCGSDRRHLATLSTDVPGCGIKDEGLLGQALQACRLLAVGEIDHAAEVAHQVLATLGE